MSVKNLCCIGIFVTLTVFVIVETFTLEKTNVDERDYQKLKAYDVKTKGKKLKMKKHEVIDDMDTGDDLGIKSKPIFARYKFARTRIEPENIHNGERALTADKIDEKIEQEDQRYVGRTKRNATELNEFKGTKKSHKKLKLAQTQAGYKNWKGKERSNDSYGDKSVNEAKKRISRRHVDYFMGKKERTSRSKRYAVTSDLKERKAIRDRFYARQKEIAEKYARKESSNPKYIHRYDLNTETNKNRSNVSTFAKTETRKIDKLKNAIDKIKGNKINPTQKAEEATTEISRVDYSNRVRFFENLPEFNTEDDTLDEYDYYMLDDSTKKSTSSLTGDNASDNGDWVKDDNNNATKKYGVCAGKLVYNHTISIFTNNLSKSDIEVSASIDGPLCVTCIRVVPVQKTNSTLILDVENSELNSYTLKSIRVKGFQGHKLTYIVKMWAVDKGNDRCKP